MGHGDEIVLGDGNFPAASNAQRLVRCDGHGVPELLEAILDLFPLDEYNDNPVALMAVVPGDKTPMPPIWKTYENILLKHGLTPDKIKQTERFEFYERAKKAYAIVASGESAVYANILLKKGVIK